MEKIHLLILRSLRGLSGNALIHRFHRGLCGYAVLGALLLWASFPPLDLWPLAWIAPIPWLLLIRLEKLDGKRPYCTLWLVGFLFWLAALHWLRLPYWATAFGWIALSFYFAFYLPVFIGLSRVAVHQLRVPIMLAAPMVWTGLELARAHLLTGMTMASLAHTQYRWIELIQISDLTGAYGVSFVIMFVAACFARILPFEHKSRVFWPLVPGAAVLAACLIYGYAREAQNVAAPGARIALIQGKIDTKFGESEDMREKIFQHYFELSLKAVSKFGPVDLIVWPETFFVYPFYIFDDDAGTRDPSVQAAGITPKEFQQRLHDFDSTCRQALVDTVKALGSPLLIGLDTQYFKADRLEIFNSALYVSATGKVLGRYDKMHLVMFGEYIPFADRLTWLYKFSPLSMGITPGTKPVAFKVKNIRLMPNICYESVLPHLIRWQINTLKAEGQEPDVLVNLTNDGWFWGSSELDMHLVCAVFRAVECRKPFLIAANTGFSAWIDADGRIIKKGPRRARATILVGVCVDRRTSWYLYYGDWPAGICLAGCCIFAVAGLWGRFGYRCASHCAMN
ncbi:MAG: apolipoprotein N-acyltransferase [Thermoguttaceae bacterium]